MIDGQNDSTEGVPEARLLRSRAILRNSFAVNEFWPLVLNRPLLPVIIKRDVAAAGRGWNRFCFQRVTC